MSSGLVQKLKEAVGESGVLTGAFDMEPYLKDWRDRKSGKAECAVFPRTTEQVVDIVRIAAEAGRPIFPQGGNTGLCYGAVPSGAGDGIVLGLHRMNRIRSIDKSDNAIIVDAGVVLTTIHEAAGQIDRTFPLHLGSEGTAQIGGLISTNAGGPNALRYGTARDLVYGLEVVLANGEVIDDLSPLRKNNTGYDLKHLFIGAEGTLGIITGASLKLYPAIRSEAHAWVSVRTARAALTLLQALQDRFDTAILACELLSRSQVENVLRHIPRTRLPFAPVPEWCVLIKLGSVDGREDLKSKLEEFLMPLIEAGALDDATIAQNMAQASEFWRVRHSVSEANKLSGHGLTHDISVKLSSIPKFIDDCEELLRNRYSSAYPVVTCHLGDGNVHYIVMFPHEVWKRFDNSFAIEEDIQTAIHDIAMLHGGSFSAEHGIGRKLTKELRRLTSHSRYSVFQKFKDVFDPQSIFNPGVVLPIGSNV
jgi:FAD/FMN-containing dehydrogenase